MPTAKQTAPGQNAEQAEGSRLRWSKLRIGLVGTAALAVVGAGIWQATKPKQLTPAERQSRAIQLIEEEKDTPKNRRQARNIALELQGLKYHDPDFPGAADYLLGIVAFRDALQAEEDKREERFTAAVHHLQDAERSALNSHYRPEWAYALGSSLHALGSTVQARPYIEEALKTSSERTEELTGKLIEIYLELKTPALLQQALTLAEDLLKTLKAKKADRQNRDLATLLKAQILVALNRNQQAIETLKSIDGNKADNLGVRIIQAQTRMAMNTRDDFLNARDTLNGVLASGGIGETQARQAFYLSGVCEESLGDKDRAINQYERTKARYPKSHEGVAAALRQARLLQEAGRNEETLAAYEMALGTIVDPETYHNRWVGIELFRAQILMAWNQWVEKREYENAIALAKRMTPLFTNIQAGELEARAYEKWAESYEKQNAPLQRNDPKTYKRLLRERWNASGDAFSRLAEQLKSSPKYTEALWKSAEHYIRGYRFRKADSQLQKYIATAQKEQIPLASAELAYTKLNEDQIAAALELLERTIRLNPKDPASFRAAYLVGVAYLEQNKIENAQQAWRDIIEAGALSPAAKEWRDALFALGCSLYQATSAKIIKKNELEAKLTGTAKPLAAPKASTESKLGNWDESIGKLSEYVRRYPEQDKHLEAQYFLARAYQKSANEYRAKLENAQIANEKQELAKEYNQRLKIAAQILRELRTHLLREEEVNGLDAFHARLLQNAFFDLGDIEYATHEYEAALVVYSNAINRYPNHVRVLLSYLQMAQCYQQLNKPEEARSTLKQAQILARRMNDPTFASSSTSFHTRQNWTEWFDWTLRMLSAPQ